MVVNTFWKIADGKKIWFHIEANGETLIYTKQNPAVGEIIDLNGRGYYKVLRKEKEKGLNILSVELDIDSLTLIKK